MIGQSKWPIAMEKINIELQDVHRTNYYGLQVDIVIKDI